VNTSGIEKRAFAFRQAPKEYSVGEGLVFSCGDDIAFAGKNSLFNRGVHSMSTSASSFRNPVTPRVKEILSWYRSENPGVLNNIARLLCTGNLAGSGKLVILPVDQGFEHGPARSFAINPAAYNPNYHFELAVETGCNAYAAPLGFLEAGAADYAGQMPLILKVNNSESLFKSNNPCPAVTAGVHDALQLGAVAIGYTIYPGSGERNSMYQDLAELTAEAKSAGLAVVVWSYPRGEFLSKNGETAIDVVAYGAQIAAQLGAHIIKVKPPTAHLEQDAAKKVYEAQKIPIQTLKDRAAHVIQSAFDNRRIVIFSGGETKGDNELLEEARQLAAGGSFGAIVGRNAFQRPREDAVRLLHTLQEIYRDAD
jgi:class I fructose-bisphosphate aldolase